MEGMIRGNWSESSDSDAVSGLWMYVSVAGSPRLRAVNRVNEFVCLFVCLLSSTSRRANMSVYGLLTSYENNIQLTLNWTKMKKRSEEMQTLRAGCSKAEPKKFAPPQTPSRGRRVAKIWSAGHYLYLQIQFGEDRCTQFRVIVVTDPQTHKQTGAITIHCAAASLSRSVTIGIKIKFTWTAIGYSC